MKTIRVALLLVVALVYIAATPAHNVQAQQKNVVVHIGQFSNDLHSTTMGLSIANIMKEAGADVTVFLDREGVRLADKRQKTLIFADSNAEELLQKLVKAGGKVIVCPHCAMVAGVDPAQMRDGCQMGSPESIAAMLMAADIVIDY